MKKYRVILEAPVIHDLNDIYDWIARDSPDAAAVWRNAIFSAINSLEESPQRCPLAPENDMFDPTIRHLIRGNHRIIFTIERNQVYVLHIRHAARRPGL